MNPPTAFRYFESAALAIADHDYNHAQEFLIKAANYDDSKIFGLDQYQRSHAVLTTLVGAHHRNSLLVRLGAGLLSTSLNHRFDLVRHKGQFALSETFRHMLLLGQGFQPSTDAMKLSRLLYATREVGFGEDPKPAVLNWLRGPIQNDFEQVCLLNRGVVLASFDIAQEFDPFLVSFENPLEAWTDGDFDELNAKGYQGRPVDFGTPWFVTH